MSDESNDDLIILERWDGWWVEDSFYDAPIAGPFARIDAAHAAKQREVARRVDDIRRERAAR